TRSREFLAAKRFSAVSVVAFASGRRTGCAGAGRGDFSLMQTAEANVIGASPGFVGDVRRGLSARPRRLSSTYLYDQRGAELFEQICTLPEYYLTRAEHEILSERAVAIARRFGTGVSLIELGSGSATKTTLVIDALLSQHGELRYFPIDVARTMLAES